MGISNVSRGMSTHIRLCLGERGRRAIASARSLCPGPNLSRHLIDARALWNGLKSRHLGRSPWLRIAWPPNCSSSTGVFSTVINREQVVYCRPRCVKAISLPYRDGALEFPARRPVIQSRCSPRFPVSLAPTFFVVSSRPRHVRASTSDKRVPARENSRRSPMEPIGAISRVSSSMLFLVLAGGRVRVVKQFRGPSLTGINKPTPTFLFAWGLCP